jgi:hypothetical protein
MICRTSTDQIKYKQPRQYYAEGPYAAVPIDTLTNSSGLGTPNHHLRHQVEVIETNSSNQGVRMSSQGSDPPASNMANNLLEMMQRQYSGRVPGSEASMRPKFYY